jgi:hypothetical protein
MPRLGVFVAILSIVLAGCAGSTTIKENQISALPPANQHGRAGSPDAFADKVFRNLDGFQGEAPDIRTGKNKIEISSFRFGGSWNGAEIPRDGTFSTFRVPQYNYFMSAQGAGGKMYLDAEPIMGCPPTCPGYIIEFNSNLSLRQAVLIANGEPANDITAGPNGTMLFAQNDNIGLLTPPNTFAFYPIPSGPVGASSIILDSNGMAYFTEPQTHSVGKYDPLTHKIIEVSLAAQGANCTPTALVQSFFDIFVECAPEQTILRLDQNATVMNQYNVGQPLSFSPHALVVGSDNIVYGGIANGGLSRIGNNMLLQPLQFPFPASPFSLNAGPDGNVYATDPQNQAIDIYIIHLMTLSPPVINFHVIGDMTNLSVKEIRYNGPWTAISSNPAVCDVHQSTPKNTFKVRAIGSGLSNIKITDRNLNNTTCQCFVP